MNCVFRGMGITSLVGDRSFSGLQELFEGRFNIDPVQVIHRLEFTNLSHFCLSLGELKSFAVGVEPFSRILLQQHVGSGHLKRRERFELLRVLNLIALRVDGQTDPSFQ